MRKEIEIFKKENLDTLHKITYTSSNDVKVRKKLARSNKLALHHGKHYKPLDAVEGYKTVADIKIWLEEGESKMIARNVTPDLITRNLGAFCLAYLSAARLGEYTQLQMNDFKIIETYRGSFLVIRLPNLKHPKIHIKHTIIALANESFFTKYIFDYYNLRLIQLNIKIPMKYLLNRNKYYNTLSQDKINKIKTINKLFNNQPFFVSRFQKPLKYRGLIYMFNRYFDCNAHFLRHVRASMLLNLYGFNLKQLQFYLGHSMVSSSEPYLKVDSSNIELKLADANLH
jgi:integrase